MCLECGTGDDKCLWKLLDDESDIALMFFKIWAEGAEAIEKELG